MRKLTLIAMSALAIILLIGCQSMKQFSPEQVIANALEESSDITYYGEIFFTTNISDNEEELTMKEWRTAEKTRLELTSETESILVVYDGSAIYMLDEMLEEAVIYNGEASSEFYLDPREQVELLLETVQDTHKIETVEDETIAGRETIHMKATKLEGEKSIVGDLEFWIDKEHWVVLKLKSINGEVYYDMEYSKIDFNEKIEDSIFEYEIPEGVEVQEIDSDYDEGVEISLEEIPAQFEQSVLYIPNDEDQHKIETISLTEIKGNLSYKDVTIDYKQEDGLPLMSLTLMKAGEELTEEEKTMLEQIGEKVTVRGNEGFFIEEKDVVRSLSWIEDSMSYSIHIIDPNLTLEKVLQWTEKMKEIKH